MRPTQAPATPRPHVKPIWLLALACVLAAAGSYLLIAALRGGRSTPPLAPAPQARAQITSGAVVRMDSPALAWSPGWRVRADGADPAEPAAPEITPSGVFTFAYTGAELALQLALGDYWGYIYVTIDGAPANLLPPSDGHVPPPAMRSGYRPLYAPELAAGGAPVATWVRVQRDLRQDAAATHVARVEVWRSWGQTPIRALAVDALPAPPLPLWPGVLLLLSAVGCTAPLWQAGARRLRRALRAGLRANGLRARPGALPEHARLLHAAPIAAGLGVALLAASVWRNNWLIGLAGLGLLALAGVQRPALWYAALLFGLPFYYGFALPLLPGRALNLVDTGVFLGLGVALLHWLLRLWGGAQVRVRPAHGTLLLPALLAAWALVSVFGAAHLGVALREWRTVFLMGLLLASGLALTLRTARDLPADVAILIGGWLLGAAVMACAALLLYPSARVIIPAEGVNRLRAFYGSPNNLALYLDRTLAVTLALALLRTEGRVRLLCLALALPQAAAYLLTFSRAGLFVALPVMLIALWVGGWVLLGRAQRSRRVLWLLAGMAVVAALALLPFVGSDRLSHMLSTAQGTGFFRINLWRSSWQMGGDHALLGVGPDNFLYAYRSRYMLPQAWAEPNLNHPHTWLLDWWTRLGLPGMALGLTFWALILVGAARRIGLRGAPAQWPALYVGITAAVAAGLAHGLLDVSYALPDLMAVWALCAVLAGLDQHLYADYTETDR